MTALPVPRNTVRCLIDEALLATLPDGAVDVWWSSPPYNNEDDFRGGGASVRHGRSHHAYADGNGRGDGHAMPEADYQAWQVRVLDAWHRTLAPDGVAFYSHKPRHKGGRLILPTEWSQRSRLTLLGQVVWDRCGTPNTDPRRFYPGHEVVLVLARRPGMRLDNRERWGDVWRIPTSHHKRAESRHPCPSPPELVRRCLAAVAAAPPGRRLLVADCYAGIGTTGHVARALGMDYLLGDRSEAYVERAERNLAAAWQPALLVPGRGIATSAVPFALAGGAAQ